MRQLLLGLFACTALHAFAQLPTDPYEEERITLVRAHQPGQGFHNRPAKYEMMSTYGGLKYRGASLDVEYYLRWISKIENTGKLPVDHFFDQGFYVQASYMLIPKTLQLYGAGSYVNGEYGKPYEFNIGLNYYPFRNQVFRINPELINTRNSPVGYLSFPTTQAPTAMPLC